MAKNLILLVPLGVGRIFAGEARSGFFQVVAKSIFPEGTTVGEILFVKLTEKHFLLK